MKCDFLLQEQDAVNMYVVLVKIEHGNSGNVPDIYALLDSCSHDTFMLERLVNDPEGKVEKYHWQWKQLMEK